jgi:2-aminoadipate transaminase
VGSFSKVLAPGLRVGYVSANKEIIAKITVCKQVADVHTNIWAQLVCEQFVTTCDFDKHLQNLREIYKHKCNLMLEGIKANFAPEVQFTQPQGGLFLWCTLPETTKSGQAVDMGLFCKKAVEEHKIAVVPGSAFMVRESDKTQSFRLNFSTPTDDEIVKGIEILGNTTKLIINN